MSTLWTWPCPGYDTITSGVGPRWGSSHQGIDIAAPRGSSVVATRGGKVTRATTACSHNYGKTVGADSCGGGYGNHIYIDHGDGYISRYAHLTALNVSVGDQVVGGQTIGSVGSTGNSTGFHLHFEVRKDGTVVDPQKLVSPSGSTIVNYDDDSAVETTTSPETYDTSISEDDVPVFTGDDTGPVVGQRVSGVTSQPVFAYVNIWLGDNLLSTNPARPNVIQSLEVDYLDNAGTKTIFTLFDNNWQEIEANLILFWNQVYIQFGYYGTGLKSDRLKYILTDYNINFTSTGAILSITALSEDAVDNLTPVNLSLKSFNPTDTVKGICQSLGYVVLDENFDSSQDIHADNPFNLLEDYPLSYIHQVIIPQASQESEELFHFYVKYSDSYKKPVAYFKKKSYLTTKTDSIRTYIYQKGYDSSVLDFSVDLKGIFGGSSDLQVFKDIKSSIINKNTKEETQRTMDVQRSVTEATGTQSLSLATKNASTWIDPSGYTEDQMSNKLYYTMKSRINKAYSATLTIVGDPTLKLWGDGNNPYVRVLNVTDEGTLHHTSGIYLVTSIHHQINGGEMTTSLSLARASTQETAENPGLEIINPKLLIK